MSLGFDLVENESVFRTVMALDIEKAMVESFNANAQPGHGPVCRRVDLSDFINPTEVLAFYLEHISRFEKDGELAARLEKLPTPLTDFRAAITQHDNQFLATLAELRTTPDYRAAYGELGDGPLGQTSVIGFHTSLRLPMTAMGAAFLDPLVWAGTEVPNGDATVGERLAQQEDVKKHKALLYKQWKTALAQLKEKSRAVGKGQLASSAGRIAGFLTFLDTPAATKVRELWLNWLAKRTTLRMAMFDGETDRFLRDAYAGREVTVLLGGPPCQGFSRIGRGKLRSLREHGANVYEDEHTGDRRNTLLFKYVLFAAALEPKVLLFENVRHFQTEVGSFRATEVLAEALQNISEGRLRYSVAMNTLDASKHQVPQTRERFFTIGLRSDVAAHGDNLAEWCLRLSFAEPVPLRWALEGLPAPGVVGPSNPTHDGKGLGATTPVALTSTGEGASGRYLEWVRRAAPSWRKDDQFQVDAHVIRGTRPDDALFYDLMGPGSRWKDYRCDASPTLESLSNVLGVVRRSLQSLRTASPESLPPACRELQHLEPKDVERLCKVVDGSLSLRLILENIEPLPGEVEHHLLAPGYMSKREGMHGDWLARMDPNRPSKTIMSHMAKDTYSYVHPFESRTLSIREAARIQTFPDWFRFGCLGLVDAFRVVGNAVPPLLSHQLALRVAKTLWLAMSRSERHAA
jgi:site-specific DNA-cytosine methylase